MEFQSSLCYVFTGVFDQLEVKTSDGTFPLIQLGQIVQKNPQLVVINLSASPQVGYSTIKVTKTDM